MKRRKRNPPTGDDLKQRGIEKVMARERENTRRRALIAIEQLAAIKVDFTADDIAAVWDAAGIAFHHPNVAGGVIRSALRDGVMVRTGMYVPSERPSRRASMVPVYRAPGFE
jgi:hypothetical protein